MQQEHGLKVSSGGLLQEQGQVKQDGVYRAKLVNIDSRVAASEEIVLCFQFQLSGHGYHDGRVVRVRTNLPEDGRGNRCQLGMLSNALLGKENFAWVPQDIMTLLYKTCCVRLSSDKKKARITDFFPLMKAGVYGQ